jgi:hypothetical protein
MVTNTEPLISSFLENLCLLKFRIGGGGVPGSPLYGCASVSRFYNFSNLLHVTSMYNGVKEMAVQNIANCIDSCYYVFIHDLPPSANSQPKLVCYDTTGLSFIAAPRTEVLSHRKPASSATFRDSCGAQNNKSNTP